MDGTQGIIALLTRENVQMARQLNELVKVVQMLDRAINQVRQELKMINTKLELLEHRNDDPT